MYKKIIAVLFAVILMIPLAATAVLGFNTENIPRYRDYISLGMLLNNSSNSSGFFDDTENYISQNLPLRSKIIGFNSLLQSKALKSTTSNVIAGKDGYLFSAEESGDALASDTMTELQMSNTVQTLDLIDEYCRDRGVKFSLVVVPNKSTALKSKLPYNIGSGSRESNYDTLCKALADREYFVDLTDALSEREDFYHKTDTHWNNLGAQAAYLEIMKNIGKTDFKTYENLKFEKSYCWHGDLTDMLYPDTKPVSDYQYISNLNDELASRFRVTERKAKRTYSPAEYLDYITDDRDNKAQHIQTKNLHENGSVIMLRDSFARALMPYFIDNFRECEFIISDGIINSYTHKIEGADNLIIEIAERNLHFITDGAQLIDAKRVDNVSAERTVASENNKAEARHDFSYYEISGRLDEKMLEKSSEIFVKLNGGSGEYCFKALPAYHESRATQPDCDTNFFISSYFDDVPSGTYNVEVVANGISTGKITQITID